MVISDDYLVSLMYVLSSTLAMYSRLDKRTCFESWSFLTLTMISCNLHIIIYK